MHSFHPSRGKTMFESFCALTVAAACVVAWQQTGASALLVIAGVVALQGVVHAAGVHRQGPAEVAEAKPEPQAVVEEAPTPPKPKKRARKKQATVDLAVEAAVTATVVELPQAIEAEEEHHAPASPLFEPQPLVRQQRAVFGRKAG